MGRLERRPREEEEAAWESRVQSEREFECLERVVCVFWGDASCALAREGQCVCFLWMRCSWVQSARGFFEAAGVVHAASFGLSGGALRGIEKGFELGDVAGVCCCVRESSDGESLCIHSVNRGFVVLFVR